VKKKILKEGKFTNYCSIDGWEFIERKDDAKVVHVVAMTGITKVEMEPKVIMVKQFRKPIGSYTIEFPAGIVDKGESTEQAALRELKEETGYIGEIVSMNACTAKSPGITSEMGTLAYVGIIGKAEAYPEDSENIEVIEVSPSDVGKLLKYEDVIFSMLSYAILNTAFEATKRWEEGNI